MLNMCMSADAIDVYIRSFQIYRHSSILDKCLKFYSVFSKNSVLVLPGSYKTFVERETSMNYDQVAYNTKTFCVSILT